MSDEPPPNILVLMADQLRRDALGCYGNPLIRTPNIDRLADGGVRFENAFCPTPVCVSSRMSFITGQRAGRHRWVTNNALPGPVPELPTIMTLLHRAGYHNHAVGKMHFRGRLYGLRSHLRMEECLEFRVDDDYLLFLKENGVRTRYPHGLRNLLYYQPQTSGIPEEFSPSRWVADRSVEFLREHARHRQDVPFFLWSSWVAPHPPFAPCEPYDRMYDPEDFPLPVHAERPLESIPPCARGHRARMCGAHLDPPRMRRIRALYAGQVSQVDDCVGDILAELDRLGLAGNTAVLFLSDHGDMLGDHGLSQKNVPYGPSVKIPLLLRWPGRTRPGRVCGDLVGSEDVLPTLIEELGLECHDAAVPLPGRHLPAVGRGCANPRSDYVIDYGAGRGRWVSVRTHEHVYSHWADGGVEELYDLRSEPHEVRNLAQARPDLTRSMRERALEWEERWGLEVSIENGAFRTWPDRPPESGPRPPSTVILNEGAWPENLPEDEKQTLESYEDAFTRAIEKEQTLSPEKLPITQYREKGGHPLPPPWNPTT